MPRKLPGWYLLLGVSLLAVLVRVVLSWEEQAEWAGILQDAHPLTWAFAVVGVGMASIAVAMGGHHWVHPVAGPLSAMTFALLMTIGLVGTLAGETQAAIAIGIGLLTLPVSWGARWKSYVGWVFATAAGMAATYVFLRLRYNWAWQWPHVATVFGVLVALAVGVLVVLYGLRRGNSRWKGFAAAAGLLAVFCGGAWLGIQLDFEQRLSSLEGVVFLDLNYRRPWFLWRETCRIEAVVLEEDDDPALLRELGYLPKLRNLQLEGSQITDEVLDSVSDWSHLEFLELKGTSVTAGGLVRLENAPNLKEMILVGSPAGGPELAAVLQRIVNSPALLGPVVIQLVDVPLNDEIEQKLAGLPIRFVVSRGRYYRLTY